MHRIIINKLGPISHCELECCPFMTFTGMQASGKSTIAKAIYFFRTIKDDISQIAQDQALKELPQIDAIYITLPLGRELERKLCEKFLRIFGSVWGMDPNMYMEYHFTPECWIKISLVEDNNYHSAGSICIDFSHSLQCFLAGKNNTLSATALGIPEDQKKSFTEELHHFFDDCEKIVYIPAGRSMITLLSTQLSYIYTTMQESQRRTLDYCTQDYLERILRLKPEFSDGLEGLMVYSSARQQLAAHVLQQAGDLINKVLRGSYRCKGGDERIEIDSSNYVKINFSSSGQQEAVWILNLLYYYLLGQEPIMFIIEEPESHLFPESQKYIMELIALVNNNGHSMLITTHSPYVLGTLNNLLYAGQFSDSAKGEAVNNIIPRSLWLDHKRFGAWFVKSGKAEDCMDHELWQIKNESIDEISRTINQEYDQILDIEYDKGSDESEAE